ncbi:MAG: P1 family peptidase [Planctomycetota bacterium]
MRIGLAYNLRRDQSEASAELLSQEDVDRLLGAIETNGHVAVPMEMCGTPHAIVDRLLAAQVDLIFNVAEGIAGVHREAHYPAIFQTLGIPFTGSRSFALHVGLDKRLTAAILERRGICVPRGHLIEPDGPPLPEDMPYPLMIKPNAEGSSKGITQDSIVEDRAQAEKRIDALLPDYPGGLIAEQFIEGRELAVPWLEGHPGGVLEVVEWRFRRQSGYWIMDYEAEQAGMLEADCPPALGEQERQAVLELAGRAVSTLQLQDLGRLDIRLASDGTPYLIEVNVLPGLRPDFSFMTAAHSVGLSFEAVIGRIIDTASRRQGIPNRPTRATVRADLDRRTAAYAHGIRVGRFGPGHHNAITDVDGVQVGHVTRIEDDTDDAGEPTIVRTGVTAVVPTDEALFNNHLVAGGFILNGIGEMSGLTQAMEWGWIETPILLTNTMSIGGAHQGIIRFMLEAHPELGHDLAVVIPLIGETDDSFLNDVRIEGNDAAVTVEAIRRATAGPVEQGSVGGGTGMISFDFAGGIGSASRVLPHELGGYTIGVLVQSNFGKMRNLTIEGRVVGKDLDPLYPYEARRDDDRGSVIVIVATDAPMLSAQLSQVAKRAALGLGRTGSHASAASGEIALAFSTANRTSRKAKEQTRELQMDCISDEFISPIYEAAVEATEEAVLNAMFHSGGMDGRCGRVAPPIPIARIVDLLGLGRPDGPHEG